MSGPAIAAQRGFASGAPRGSGPCKRGKKDFRLCATLSGLPLPSSGVQLELEPTGAVECTRDALPLGRLNEPRGGEFVPGTAPFPASVPDSA
eukprot:3941305-Rhodomonas_salina.3